MILLRPVQEQDISSLKELADIPGFINLPTDTEELKEKVLRSKKSFLKQIKNFSDQKFIFVAEDISTHKILGTSMIASQHGTRSSPHFYFEVGHEEKYSDTLGTGFIHGTLELKLDFDGPSEIGGLVVHPDHRKGSHSVGRQISFVRFLFCGLYPEMFKENVIAELLPPLNRKGLSPLWEAVGRRFTNMDYWEADKLSQKNKEFMYSLFPSGKIYTTFLTAEARSAIGKVGDATKPVLHMLEKIGFQYTRHVDPFDGGPHLWAKTKELLPVRSIEKCILRSSPPLSDTEGYISGLITAENKKISDFQALSVNAKKNQDEWVFYHDDWKLVFKKLSWKEGQEIYFMPYYGGT